MIYNLLVKHKDNGHYVEFAKNVKKCYNNSIYVKRHNKRKFMSQSQWSKGYIITHDSRAAQTKEGGYL